MKFFIHYLKQYSVKKISIPPHGVSNKNEVYYSYVINKKINNDKKNILLSNLGYNFKRLIFLKNLKKSIYITFQRDVQILLKVF